MLKEDILFFVAFVAFTFGTLISIGAILFLAVTHPIDSLLAVAILIGIWFLVNYVFAKPLGEIGAHLLAPMIAKQIMSYRPGAGYDPGRRHIKRLRRRK